ncbi:MAG: hypothetical protein CME36_11825 [unclassified Hahellaceae]|nr:hypothetical protein [Hahellaceae bacterium]
MKPWRAVGNGLLMPVLTAVMLLGGCSAELFGDPEADFGDYRQRLARVFDTAFPAAPPPPEVLSPRYPQRRDLQLQASEFSLGILDIFALDACTVGQLVAQRNSALGKVMSASAVWRYEQAFLASVDDCVQTLGEDAAEATALMTALTEVRDIKRRELGIAQWNATFASAEFQSMFSTGDGLLQRNFRVAPSQQLSRVLERLLAYVEGEPTAALEDLETINATLVANPYPGRVLLSTQAMTAELESISDTLEALMTGGDGKPCRPAMLDEETSKIAVNVLEQVYVKRIQPYLAELQKAGHAWIGPLARLADAISIEEQPAVFKAFAEKYLDPKAGIWADFQAASRRHASLWTQVRPPVRPGSAAASVTEPDSAAGSDVVAAASGLASDCSR